MKKNLLILLSVLALIFTAYSQVNINITLKVKTNNLKEEDQRSETKRYYRFDNSEQISVD